MKSALPLHRAIPSDPIQTLNDFSSPVVLSAIIKKSAGKEPATITIPLEIFLNYCMDREIVEKAINGIEIFKAPNKEYPKVRKVMNDSLSELFKDNVDVWNQAAFETITKVKKELKIK